jgi:hypothetical protein
MKIGILGCFYDCAEYLDDVLDPWRRIKNDTQHEFFITSIHCRFKEYVQAGCEEQNDNETISKIHEHSDVIDAPFFSPVPLIEAEARNIALQYLQVKDADVLWLLDGDEFYTVKQINDIINYVSANPDPFYYKINFKNYVFDETQWVDGFNPNRIFYMNKSPRLDKMFWDNDVYYEGGIPQTQLPLVEIPKEVAHVKHLTWLSNEKSKKKYEYNLKHIGVCSYEWDYDDDKLIFSKEYYKDKEIPTIHKD